MRRTLRKTNSSRSIRRFLRWREDAMSKSKTMKKMLKMKASIDLKAKKQSSN